MKIISRNIFTVFAALLMALVTLFPDDAEAKRMGGGRSFGRQSDNVMQRRAPERTSQQATNNATPQDAGNKRSGIGGMIAGVAAALGLAALFSYFGGGGNFLMILVIALVGFMLFRMFARKSATASQSNAGNNVQPNSARTTENSSPFSAFQGNNNATNTPAAGQLEPKQGDWVIPQGFDVNQFLQEAKQQFLTIQKAFDNADVSYLENHLTAEMFREIKMDIDTRLGENVSEFLVVNADLMGVEVIGNDAYLASVRFSGMIQETPGAAANRFEEVWNLEKQGNTGWLLAGIQQL